MNGRLYEYIITANITLRLQNKPEDGPEWWSLMERILKPTVEKDYSIDSSTKLYILYR